MPKRSYSFLLVSLLALGTAACSKSSDASQASLSLSGDQADGNLAPASDSSQQVQYQQPQEQQAPAQQYQAQYRSPQTNYADPQQNNGDYYTDDYQDSGDSGDQQVYALQPPPPLPVYSQPPCPGDNYLWTPGYWSYANVSYAEGGYYWVPGAWVLAPYVDALWTPPFWDFYSGRYRWHRGYWGRHIGFYGGINYGFGYTGRGYYGGYWSGGRFAYNRSVTNININIVHNNVYERSAPVFTNNRVSYNGGPQGVRVRPIPAELAVLREARSAPVQAQVQHARAAQADRAQFASVNQGRPARIAVAQPLPTNYREPAARPAPAEQLRPNAQMRQDFRPRPQATQPVPNIRPGGEPARAQDRPAPNQPAPLDRQPVQRPQPFQREQQQQGRAPEVRPQPQPVQRPEVQRPEVQRPETPRPEIQRPEQQRPEPQFPRSAARPQSPPQAPVGRPQQQERQAPPQTRPMPDQRQAAPPPQRQMPEARPAPASAARPAPQQRPEPGPRQAAPGRQDRPAEKERR